MADIQIHKPKGSSTVLVGRVWHTALICSVAVMSCEVLVFQTLSKHAYCFGLTTLSVANAGMQVTVLLGAS
jgi:hypothetical protein